MFEYYNNTLTVHASWLYEEASLISYNNYKQLVCRGWLRVLRRACRNTPALVEYDSMREDIKQQVVAITGDPYKIVTRNILQDLMTPDYKAIRFFLQYRMSSGEALPSEKQREYANNAMIYNGISEMLQTYAQKSRAMGQKKTKIWQNISNCVNTLEVKHSVPSNYRKVKERHDRYISHGYESLIHAGYGNKNRNKIVGDIAEWWLAMYSLPNKQSIPEIMRKYNYIRENREWPDLSDAAVALWLAKPEQERIWYIGRHGKEAWTNKFGYTLKRDKSQWFPNIYWAIDGSKLDWVHYEDNALGMAGRLKIDPVIDVYSEKIIGWSYSTSETHIDHFKAIKMAVTNTGRRPYLLTYDQQSGHKAARMQELYSAIVAPDTGAHYPHQSRRKGNPVEGIFSRLQQQVLNQAWFSDKQGMRTKKLDSRPNVEFLKEQKAQLKTRKELEQWWEYCVNKWNSMPHPKFKDQSRSEVYEHAATMESPIDILDMIPIFWLEETKPIRYRRSGIPMKLAGEIYDFEVYDSSGNVDLEFRRKYVGEKLIIRYDPELLNDGVQLWHHSSAGKVYVATALPKRAHKNIPVLMTQEDKAVAFQDIAITEKEFARDIKDLLAIQQNTGITPEKLMEEQEFLVKMGGDLPKEQRNQVESAIHKL